MISRRQLISMGSVLCVYALLGEARASAASVRGSSAALWIDRQKELAVGLTTGSVSQLEWYAAVNALACEIDLEDIARLLRSAPSRPPREPRSNEPRRRFIDIKSGDGISRLPYGVAVFDFAADSVIAPHAHRNMASAHMVMDGRIRIRTYDRIEDEDGSLVVRPTSDVVAEAGHAAAMTSARDNVHWFESRTSRAMTVDVVVIDLDESSPSTYEIEPIDPAAAQMLPDGAMRVPLISFEESLQRYGARL